MNYLVNPGIHAKIARHLGVNPNSYQVQEAFSIDFRELPLEYQGKPLFPPIEGRKIDPLWGMRTRWIENQSGGYWENCDFPFAGFPPEIVDNWPMPNPDDFDYAQALAFCKAHKEYAIHYGNPGLGDIMNTAGMLAGVEEMLMGLISGEEVLTHWVNRRLSAQLAILERVLEYCGDYITFIWTGEDLGTQRGPLISPQLFQTEVLPPHKKIADLAKAFGKPVLMHSCGSSKWAFEDLISIGIQGIDTLQPEAEGMAPWQLAKQFGNQLLFHGCISTAGPLAYGTPKETETAVQQVLEVMKPYQGYCLAPTHLIQDNTPIENVLALYRSGLKFGTY